MSNLEIKNLKKENNKFFNRKADLGFYEEVVIARLKEKYSVKSSEQVF